MNRLNKQQKDRVTQFRNITGANDKQAIDCLRQAGWSVEGGIEVFYASGMQATPSADTSNIEKMFQRYKDAGDSTKMMAEGIATLCEDLGVEPSDIALLVLSYHLSARIMCEYSREEWVTGLSKLGIDSLDKLRGKLSELRGELQDTQRFHDVYNYSFQWACEEGKKVMQLDTALAMWQLLYADERRWQYIDDWCEFLQEHHKGRTISRDTWAQLFEFARQIKPDFSNYDDAGAWPYLMDEFVEYMRKKNGMQVD